MTESGDAHFPRPWLAMLDRLIPSAMHGDVEELRRGRLFLAIQTALTLAAFFFGWQAQATTGRIEGPSLILLCGGALSLLNVPLAWWQHTTRNAAIVVCIETVAVVLLCGWYGQGASDASQTFLLVTPIVAAFTVGRRFGVAVTTIAIVGSIVLFFGPQLDAPFIRAAATDDWFHAAGAVAVLAILASFAYIYEGTRAQTLELLQREAERGRDKNLALQKLNEQLAAHRDEIVVDARRKDAFLREMRTTSEHQEQGLERTRKVAEQLRDTVFAIASSVETLAATTTASDERLSAMAQSAIEVQDVVTALIAGLDDSANAVVQLKRSVGEVQGGLAAVSSSAHSTSDAMVSMEDAVSRVAQGAGRTASLSEAVIVTAARGQAAVRHALDGVDEIRENSRMVHVAIHDLTTRVRAISQMNAIIQEVAIEINVLALNASIIASQAGSHGAGFKVVADQIKALAARTASSSRDIVEVIRAVNVEAKSAIIAAERGTTAIDAGVTLSQEAARALEEIVASAHLATQQVKGIDTATKEQARRTHAVSEAMADVTRLLALAEVATTAHVLASARIDGALAGLRKLAPDLQTRSRAQADGAEVARAALARITEMAARLSSVQSAQAEASAQALRAVEAIQGAQLGQSEALAHLQAPRST